MDNKSKLASKLLEIFKILSVNNNLKFYEDKKIQIVADNKLLLQITPQQITIPISSDHLFVNKSPLGDNFININHLDDFINELSGNHSIIGLNHVGFCYKVDSQNEEREKVKNLVDKTKWHLYEMESNDAGLWLFIGNNGNWQDPLVELLPVEKTDDKWVSYWLPHIQIDIDTTLSHQELEKIINSVFKGKIIPFRSCVIKGVVYSIRVRLGIISGVNINLDLATNKRDIKYSKQEMLRVIV